MWPQKGQVNAVEAVPGAAGSWGLGNTPPEGQHILPWREIWTLYLHKYHGIRIHLSLLGTESLDSKPGSDNDRFLNLSVPVSLSVDYVLCLW